MVDLNKLPAPYIKNTSALVELSSSGKKVVFYRYSKSHLLNAPACDLFAVGDFALHEMKISDCEPGMDLRSDFQKLSTDGGALAGFMAYESGFMFEPDKWNQLGVDKSEPLWRWMELPCWYEADHEKLTGTIVSMPGVSESSIELLLSMISTEQNHTRGLSDCETSCDLEDVSRMGECSESEYELAIGRILEDIAAGRYYELNYTQRFRKDSKVHPSRIFRMLFDKLSPTRGFYADFGDQWVASLSPELYLKKQGETISTRPIKGSRRGLEISDAEKEKLAAEHVMVVDLARNDLGRVCDLEWVGVEDYGREDMFGGLRHMESRIQGCTSFDWHEVISATFPAASITGMPKVIVVQAISDYEKSLRNIYTGSCGCIFPGGDFDLNVAIRTLSAKRMGNKWCYEFGAGGAITADSTAGDEYRECLFKAWPLAEALHSE